MIPAVLIIATVALNSFMFRTYSAPSISFMSISRRFVWIILHEYPSHQLLAMPRSLPVVIYWTRYHNSETISSGGDMAARKIGILHPGQMGVSIAANAKGETNRVVWASEGRGSDTKRRADEAGLEDAGTIARLCAECDVIFSVCPPHAAEDVAAEVVSAGFTGTFVDANAISPDRTSRIAATVKEAGITFVDGGIVGGPAWKPGTVLYLSGAAADEVATCFGDGPLEVAVIGDEIGRASALKMCFAAYTKGTTALLSAILATAENLGVRDDLYRQWTRGDAGFPEQTENRVRNVTAKAWRFAGEMDEIAATFRSAGLPGEFHDAAAEIYRRTAGFKDAPETPSLAEVIAALARDSGDV
ncbi:MAG: NAD(P)-dependent oxidoreductase [Spirochaetaceae bacterium]|nr:MAG: NAD(P)-dependent oxidoreductase [Spirochaetaceae bacterium]